MKTLRPLVAIAAALATGFILARWCAAQSPSVPKKEPPSYDFGALHQLESFVTYLQNSKETNTLRKFDDYCVASMASQNSADLGVTLRVLQCLKNGHTNEAYELLEGRLDMDIIGLVASYRRLPESAKDQPGLAILCRAREYRAKYPFQHRYKNVDDGVAEAFQILDENKK